MADNFVSKLLKNIFRLNFRAYDMNTVIDALYNHLYMSENYEYPYFMGHYVGDEGDYLVFTDRGRLYRITYKVSNDEISFGEAIEVVVEHVEVEQQRAKVFRGKDGQLKFVGIGSVSALNRMGEIDSTLLFDSMEENFDAENPPNLNLYHIQHKAFAFGKVHGIARNGNILIVWGDIDETTPLGKYAERRISKGDYGMSIEFIPTDSTKATRVGDISIPTYTEGFFVGIAALREDMAASYLTNLGVNREARNKMKNKKQLKEILLDFTEDEGFVEDFLTDIDNTESRVKEENMITRTNDKEADVTKDVETDVEDKNDIEGEVGEFEIEIDEEIIEQVSERTIAATQPKFDEINDKIRVLTETIETLTTTVRGLSEIEGVIEKTKETETPLSRRKVVRVQRPTEKNETVKDDSIDGEEGKTLDWNKIRSERIAKLRTEYSENSATVKKFE